MDPEIKRWGKILLVLAVIAFVFALLTSCEETKNITNTSNDPPPQCDCIPYNGSVVCLEDEWPDGFTDHLAQTTHYCLPWFKREARIRERDSRQEEWRHGRASHLPGHD